MAFNRLLENLIRKKPQKAWLPDIPLRRCLTTLDLTSLGFGTIVGAGLYVAIGEVARDTTGPSVVLSILLASIAALLCALSFAEYGSRFPDTGSSYVYTYKTLGEIWAFVVGWNIVLEFLISGASLARKCSQFINSASNGKLFLFFEKYLSKHWHVIGNEPFPDLLAASLVLAVMAILCLGVRTSINFHNIIAAVNVIVITFIIIYGSFFASVQNWTHSFTPHGLHGILRGTAVAFFAFTGFDVVAEAAEEAIQPEKSIPRSLFIIIIMSTLAYVGVATVLTLMMPYEKLKVDAFAPLADAFQERTFRGAKYIVLCGGICAVISALFCSIYSTSRVIHSMSVDGLLFRWFSKINENSQVPGRATFVSGIITAILAMMFNVNQLVELLSIGTLVAYTKVAISVLVSRYQPGVESVPQPEEINANMTQWLRKLVSFSKEKQNTQQSRKAYERIKSDEDNLVSPNTQPSDSPGSTKSGVTESTASRAKVAVSFLVVGIAALAVMFRFIYDDIYKGKWWAVYLICFTSTVIIVSFVVIQLQPQNSTTFPFMVCFVPFTPALTIFINIVLLANLNEMTYVRFGVWMVLGFVIYLFYGYRHSLEAVKPADKVEGEDITVLQETPNIEQNINIPQLEWIGRYRPSIKGSARKHNK